MHLCQGQYTQKTDLTPKDAGGGPQRGRFFKGDTVGRSHTCTHLALNSSHNEGSVTFAGSWVRAIKVA